MNLFRRLKTLHIPDEPILQFLGKHQGEWATHGHGFSMPTVQDAMPKQTSRKLQLEKMNDLLDRGLVSGCGCGCRGDWEIKDMGLKIIKQQRTAGRTGAGSDWDDMRKGKRVRELIPSSVDNIIDWFVDKNRG